MTSSAPAVDGGNARLVRNIAIMALVAFAAGVAGATLGGSAGSGSAQHTHSSIHDLIHDGLSLSAEQERALEAVEARFDAERRRLQNELAEANRAVADAVSSNASMTTHVDEALDQNIEQMRTLQRVTVEHLYEMRAVLTDEQAAVFDQRVQRALLREHE